MLFTELREAPPLRGRFVELVPLSPGHARDLAVAAKDPEVSRLLRNPPGRTEQEVTARIAAVMAQRDAGAVLPFATVLRETGGAVGMTCFFHIDRANRSVEIGGTWLDSALWRTAVNSESKLLLLTRAFETEGFHRVWLQTDERNERSRRAIERLGAVLECRRREDVLLPDGTFRTSVVYGILESEWPSVRLRLEESLSRPWVPPIRPPSGGPPGITGGDPPRPAVAATGLPATSFRSPVEMKGRFTHLVPLARSHLEGLVRAGQDSEVWTHLRIRHGDTPEGMAGLVEDLLGQQARGEVLPFTVFVGQPERAAGITRYLDIDRANHLIELGTWIDRALWGTPVNTELKLLMLGHAFEVENVHRVELRTDEHNARSQRAIERIGAVLEGRLREHYLLTSGRYRTSLYYSILRSEWPSARRVLGEYLSRTWDTPL